MSESDGGPGRREVAYRLFAAEFEDADLDYSESDEERAPNYVITPTGGRVNRLYVVGVLTEVEPVSDDVLRARVVDPTGAFVLYAGQYQQDERAFLERAEPPAFVAVTGKARTFQPDDSDRVFTSVRPESISEVDAETRDRWTVDAAEQTLDRVDAMATAMALDASGDRLRTALQDRGVEAGLADGIALALGHYGTTPTYLAAVRDLALDAARLVAGDVEEVAGLDVSPADTGDVTATDLLDEPVEPLASADDAEEATETPGTGKAETATPDATESTVADSTVAGSASAGSSSATAASAEPSGDTDASSETPGATATGETPDEAAEPTDAATADTAPDGATADSAPDEQAGDVETDNRAADVAADEGDGEGPGDFEPGEFDLDDEEREEIEEEYGTEFQTGTEVEEPGEADIETPDPDGDLQAEADDADDAAPSADAEETEDESPEPAATADAEPAEDEAEPPGDESADDVDLVDAAVSTMEDLDEGDGAQHDTVVATVANRTGADAEAVEDAIQDALMDGRCYEPDDETLKPI